MSDLEGGSSRRPSLPGAPFFLLALWLWAIWSCAEHWRGNPNYSYGWAVPILALGFGLRRYLISRPEAAQPAKAGRPGIAIGITLALGLLVFGLEYAREAMWHPQVILWSICLLCTGLTLLIFRIYGGVVLARAELFPVLFFLTAVPWPPRFEQPLTAALMRSVAAGTTEMLHWIGIVAQSSGGAIALNSGLVGITEACSGIRSLQAGIMFGLAVGEWFLLRPGRRIVLLGLAIVLALATNLARTLTLALQAEWHGADRIDQVHDLVGNIIITSLVLAIWLAGKLLSRGASEGPLMAKETTERVKQFFPNLFKERSVTLAAATVALIVGIFSARLVYARGESLVHMQTAPHFIAQVGGSSGNRLASVPREVWNELRPTSGEYVRHDAVGGSGLEGDCFHFFWKPSVWNRFVLVHRPDICMPGIGWQPNGSIESIDLEFEGRAVRFYLFRFKRGNTHALELWGAWRNGESVPVDYTTAQIFGTAAPSASLNLEGKRRSATEIVACSVADDGKEPSPEIAVALLQSVFHYKSDE